jgi:trehalose-phosphatase
VPILDFDGTLAPIAGVPDAAVLAPATRAVLRTLAAHPRARVVVLSGRSLRDLVARVAVRGVVYGGCHGLEIVGRGLSFVHPRARAGLAAVAAARAALRRGLRRVPGALVEDKGLAVTAHYRRVPPSRRAEVFALVARVARTHPGLAVVAGKEVREFVPRIGWNKGRAARWIVARLTPTLPRAARPPLVLFAGDDVTDEDAFAALRGRGVTVRVGARRGGADYRVAGVRELRTVLDGLRRRLD